MRRRFFIIATFIVTTVLVGATIHAQREGGPSGPNQGPEAGPAPQGRGGPGPQVGPGRGGGPRSAADGPFFGLGVDLTDDQRSRVQGIVRAGRDESSGIADELQFARRTLHRELFADTRNGARVTELTTRIVALEKQLLDIHVKSQTAVAVVLTAEQRQSVRAGDVGGPGGPGRRGGGRAAAR